MLTVRVPERGVRLLGMHGGGFGSVSRAVWVFSRCVFLEGAFSLSLCCEYRFVSDDIFSIFASWVELFDFLGLPGRSVTFFAFLFFVLSLMSHFLVD